MARIPLRRPGAGAARRVGALPRARRRVVLAFRLAAVAWMALIFALSAWPGAASEGTYTFFGDWNAVVRTAAHVVVFGFLAVLWKVALTPRDGSYPQVRWWYAFAIAALYGVSDEVHQHFVPGRFCRWQDVVSDAVGAAGALLALWLTGSLLRSSGYVQ